MALTDREKRLLAEMEAALATEDPSLQSTLAGVSANAAAGSRLGAVGLGKASLLFIAGIATLFSGLIAKVTLLGAAGFILALAGLLLALRALSRASGKAGQARRAPRTSFSDRLNQRWDNRHN